MAAKNQFIARIPAAIRIMLSQWQIFILLPAMLGSISALVLTPLIFFLSLETVTFISRNFAYSLINSILSRLFIYALLSIPAIITNIIAYQAPIFALINHHSATQHSLTNIVSLCFKNCSRYITVNLYSWWYVYSTIILSTVGISMYFIFMATFSISTTKQAMSTILTFLLTLISFLASVGIFAGIVIAIIRSISTIFTFTIALVKNISAKQALEQSLQICKTNWRTMIIQILVLIGFGIIVNLVLVIIINTTVPRVAVSTIDGAVNGITNSFITTIIYLLFKSLSTTNPPSAINS